MLADRVRLRAAVAACVERAIVLLTLIASTPLAAQTGVRLDVRDDVGAPVAFAVVTLAGGVTQVADDSGSVVLRVKDADSLNLRVRRIGYGEFFGWVGREGGVHRVTLRRLAATLAAVEVTERASTPLSRTGFYDRMDRVQRGSIVGELLTPEELDARAATSVTRMVTGSRYARINSAASGRGSSVQVILGRGGCAMTVIVDGQRVTGTAQDVIVKDEPTSITPRGTRQEPRDELASKVSIDDVVDGRSVMAIEIYPSTANAPVELQSLGGRGSCGIVAIWTGPRQ